MEFFTLRRHESLTPAMPSCPTTVLSRPPLVDVLARVPDPRDPRGVRHSLATVLTLAQAAVATGAKTLLAISEWIGDANRDVLTRLGISRHAVLPCESTIRRTLAAVDADDLDARLGAWMATRTGNLAGRQVIAVDGKSMRGATDSSGVMPHLLSALRHDTGVVAGQLAVDAKSNEIPALPLLLDSFDLTDVVVTADALHCQRSTATYITGRGGHYVLTVKGNQPGLRKQLKQLPWSKVPATTSVDISHGRRMRRTIRAVQAPDWINFPGAAQVLQLRRTRTIKGRKHTEVVYVICSLDMTHASRADVAAWVQGHWCIENALHWVRDVTFDEDRHQLRTGHGPQVMAALRNTTISVLRLSGWTNLAAGLRHHARDCSRPIDLILTA